MSDREEDFRKRLEKMSTDEIERLLEEDKLGRLGKRPLAEGELRRRREAQTAASAQRSDRRDWIKIWVALGAAAVALVGVLKACRH